MVYMNGMEGKPNYLYVGVNAYTQGGETVPVKLTILLQDEGHSNYYELPQITIYPLVEKSKYLSIHSYGEVEGMRIYLEANSEADLQVTDIVYDAKVPWFVSLPRILAVFAGLSLVWSLRPGSGIYVWRWSVWQKRVAVGLLLLANSAFFLFLVKSNPAFLNPVWPYHQQYHQLAVALSQGRVSIDAGSRETREVLAELANPYDYATRMATVPYADQVWDICYYQGNFYVYFGIVPVLLFYLPCYLFFHAAFPTWLGVFLSGVGILGGVYFLFAQIRRRWFPETPYISYLLLSLIGGNSINLFCAMLHADFYYLPILVALCFTLWGMGLILSAVSSWNQEKAYVKLKLAAGGLCMALTAGCRPQFLVGSVLLMPILLPSFWENRKEKHILKRLIVFALPYFFVAVGLMYYNAVRFGSVFDFGANYNLTTNDMTLRGVNLERLPDGIFMYLFQPISLKLNFPFAEVTALYSNYMGSTIMDWTFGGALWTRPIVLVLVCISNVKKELKQKGLYGFTLLSIGLALAVIFADTEMAGILNRYFTDFLWLLIIPAGIVLFQMLEKYRGMSCYKWVLLFLLCAGTWGMFYELAIAFRGCGLINDNAHRYYLIGSFFQ